MPDFPNELVEAAAILLEGGTCERCDGEGYVEIHDPSAAHAGNPDGSHDEYCPDCCGSGRAAFEKAARLIEQRVIDRLAREAGEPERHVVWLCAGCDVCHPPDGSPREQRYPCAPDGGSPSCGGALVVLAEDAERWVACGVAAERARWEAKQRPRITHGRHCTCTPCAREDWTNPALAPCGMHGKDCPQEYAPLGAAGDPVPAAALSPEQTTATEPEGSGDAAR